MSSNVANGSSTAAQPATVISPAAKEAVAVAAGASAAPGAASTSSSTSNNKEQAKTDVSAPEYTKKKLVRKSANDFTKQKHMAWLYGHCSVVVFGVISIVFQLLWLPNYYYINSICYRLSLLSAITALVATTAHVFGMYDFPAASTLLSHQNFQYLILAFVWIFTFKSTLKLLPFLLISILQIANAKTIVFVLKQQTFLASLIAYDELALMGYLLLRTILFRGTSGFQLSLFLVFYWLRVLYNKETGNLFKAIVERLDGKIQSVKNPKVLKVWTKIKYSLEQK